MNQDRPEVCLNVTGKNRNKKLKMIQASVTSEFTICCPEQSSSWQALSVHGSGFQG